MRDALAAWVADCAPPLAAVVATEALLARGATLAHRGEAWGWVLAVPDAADWRAAADAGWRFGAWRSPPAGWWSGDADACARACDAELALAGGVAVVRVRE